MKRLIIALLIVLLGFLGGCNALALPKPLMIEKLEICSIVCVDYENEQYTLSLGLKKIVSGGGQEGQASGDNSADVASATNSNLGDALSQVVASRTRNVYFGDVETIVFGEQLVTEGIDKAIDFFIRSAKFNQFAKVYATSGKAEELLQQMTEDDMVDSIEQKSDMDTSTSFTTRQTLLSMITLLERDAAGVMPLIVSKKDEDKTTFELEGMVVIKDKKKVGQLGKQESRGYNVIKNNIKNGTIGLQLEGYQAGIDNLTINTKTKVDSDGGQLIVNINSQQSANISFVTDSPSKNIAVELQIEQQLSQDIKNDIMACIQKVKDYKSDFIGLWAIYRSWHKTDYKNIVDKDQMLQNMTVNIDSAADIKRALQVREY